MPAGPPTVPHRPYLSGTGHCEQIQQGEKSTAGGTPKMQPPGSGEAEATTAFLRWRGQAAWRSQSRPLELLAIPPHTLRGVRIPDHVAASRF